MDHQSSAKTQSNKSSPPVDVAPLFVDPNALVATGFGEDAQIPACALSFSRSFIDFPAVAVGLAVVLADELPSDMDHRSSNPDKPLADADGALDAGAFFGAVEVGNGVDVVVGESGCDDVQRDCVLFCAGVGDIVAEEDWDCLLLVMDESGFSGVLNIGEEVVVGACNANAELAADTGRRFAGGDVLSISISVGRDDGGEDGEGAAWKSANSSSSQISATNDDREKGLTIESRQGRQCLVGARGVGGRGCSTDRRIIESAKEVDLWFFLL